MTKTILLHENALSRIADRLPSSDDIRFATVNDEGDFHLEGAATTSDDLTIDGAWMSLDFMRNNASRSFAVHALKSDTLQWMQTAAAGLDNPFFQDIMRKGVRITNSDAQAPAIAEFVMSQVLMHYHPVRQRLSSQEAHEWKRLAFREIAGETWTIIGLGNIGQEIAKRARGFDAHVVGLRRTPGDHIHANETAHPDEIFDLLPRSDVVVLACPLTDATSGMGDATFFQTMKEAATLVNIGRGGLINEEALIAGLEVGKPDFAILDVFQSEPLPQDNPLWDHPKVAVSGHTSAFGSGTAVRGDDLFLDNLGRFLAGSKLRNDVDPSRL